MLRLLGLLTTLLILSLGSTPSMHAAAGAEVTLSDGDLPRPVKLARSDADAFVRRLVPPPKLDNAPDFQGTGYKITSAYWDEVLRNGRSDREPAAADAFYFEEGGYVVARQGGRDVWLVLDLRQRAIVDRYLSLARAGVLRSEPGVLEVLSVASRSENITVEIAGVPLDDAQRRNFWSLIAISPRATFADPAQPPLGSRGAWLVFGLEEGRSVQVFYERQSALFVDFFGSEIYPVSTPMATLIDTVVPRTTAGLPIVQEQSTGSFLWWVVMGGGGFVCIGTAILLQRRLNRARAAP